MLFGDTTTGDGVCGFLALGVFGASTGLAGDGGAFIIVFGVLATGAAGTGFLLFVAGGFFCRAGVTVASRIVLLLGDETEAAGFTAAAAAAGCFSTTDATFSTFEAGDFSTLLLVSGTGVETTCVTAGGFSSTLSLGTGLLCEGTAWGCSLDCSTVLVGACSTAINVGSGVVCLAGDGDVVDNCDGTARAALFEATTGS